MIHRNSKSGFVFQLLVIWASHGLAHGVFILRFVKSPPRVTQVPERSVAILPCAAESILQPLTYKWLLNGQLLSIRSNGNYTWQGYQGNLLIPSLRQNSLNDGGLFQCTASNSLGSILGPISVLRVAYLEPYEGQAILKGYSKYTFESFCLDPPLVTSVPMATVTWSRVTGSVIHDGDKLGRVLIASGGHLCVLAADNTDIDMYTCTLNNPVTQQSFSIKHSVALVVKPKISWYKGNNVLSPSSKYGFVHNTTSTKIAIYRPTKADEGTYRCVAIDTSNVVFVAQAQLTVKTEIEESSPKFDGTLPPSMVAFLGKSAKITCPRARGALIYTWYHNAVPVSPDHRVSVKSNGSLLIKDVMRPDNGIYQVFAENSFGKSSAEPVYLLVSELNVISTTSTSPSPLPSPSPTSITPPASVTLPNSTNSIQPTTVAKEQPSSREPFTEPNTRKNLLKLPSVSFSKNTRRLSHSESTTPDYDLRLDSKNPLYGDSRTNREERFESNVYVSIHDDSNPLYSGFCPNRQEPNSSKNPMYSGTHHDRQDPDSGKNHLYSGIHHNRQEPNSSKNPLYSGTHHDREDPDSGKNHLYSGIHPDRQYHDVDKTHLYSSIYLDSQDPHKDKNHPYSGIHPDGSGAFPSRTSTRETSTTSNIYDLLIKLKLMTFAVMTKACLVYRTRPLSVRYDLGDLMVSTISMLSSMHIIYVNDKNLFEIYCRSDKKGKGKDVQVSSATQTPSPTGINNDAGNWVLLESSPKSTSVPVDSIRPNVTGDERSIAGTSVVKLYEELDKPSTNGYQRSSVTSQKFGVSDYRKWGAETNAERLRQLGLGPLPEEKVSGDTELSDTSSPYSKPPIRLSAHLTKSTTERIRDPLTTVTDGNANNIRASVVITTVSQSKLPYDIPDVDYSQSGSTTRTTVVERSYWQSGDDPGGRGMVKNMAASFKALEEQQSPTRSAGRKESFESRPLSVTSEARRHSSVKATSVVAERKKSFESKPPSVSVEVKRHSSMEGPFVVIERKKLSEPRPPSAADEHRRKSVVAERKESFEARRRSSVKTPVVVPDRSPAVWQATRPAGVATIENRVKRIRKLGGVNVMPPE
ncbi:predicted protein [Nematostella vectensis]|uniref:Ig-like domain-containing protein n=1 Tax=Nematostella vectensis TaxID=45351 RepID=A7SZJ3_NEMVE|nr:predicted protein [Nematostella vectensis]|eukprot:XP_001622980.1 predicted protein [Nematostella vectensis]